MECSVRTADGTAARSDRSGSRPDFCKRPADELAHVWIRIFQCGTEEWLTVAMADVADGSGGCLAKVADRMSQRLTQCRNSDRILQAAKRRQQPSPALVNTGRSSSQSTL